MVDADLSHASADVVVDIVMAVTCFEPYYNTRRHKSRAAILTDFKSFEANFRSTVNSFSNFVPEYLLFEQPLVDSCPIARIADSETSNAFLC